MKFHGRCCHFYWVPKKCLLGTFSHVLVKHLVKSQHLASSIPNPCPCWNSPLNDYNYHLRTKRDSVPKMDMTSERVEQWLQCCCWSLDLLLHRPAVLFILFTVGILGRCTKEYHGWNPEHLPFDLNGGPTNLKIDPSPVGTSPLTQQLHSYVLHSCFPMGPNSQTSYPRAFA